MNYYDIRNSSESEKRASNLKHNRKMLGRRLYPTEGMVLRTARAVVFVKEVCYETVRAWDSRTGNETTKRLAMITYMTVASNGAIRYNRTNCSNFLSSRRILAIV